MNEHKNIIPVLAETGQFEDIDIAFGRFLRGLHPHLSSSILMAALLTSKAYRNGDVCLLLEENAGHTLAEKEGGSREIVLPSLDTWTSQLKACPVVGNPGDFKPLILDSAGRLYLHKLWQYEKQLAGAIAKKLGRQKDMPESQAVKKYLKLIFGEKESQGPDWQKIAALTALINNFTVISGGPGTGKTTTVVKLLALITALGDKENNEPRIALAAPTGKAAARLEDSINEAKNSLDFSQTLLKKIPTEAVTLHRLLGARRHSPEFMYNSENPLPYDVVIVDEASMVDQMMISKLMDALLEHTKLVLLGDKDQLASVEAGSILGDLCGSATNNVVSNTMACTLKQYAIAIPESFIAAHPAPLSDHISLLQKNYRFSESSGIGRLTRAIKEGNAKSALDILQAESLPSASLTTVEAADEYHRIITGRMIKCFSKMRNTSDLKDRFAIFNRLRILAAHRSGPWGVEYINYEIERALEKKGLKSPYQPWYDGKPIIINKNNHSMGLSNGDFGLCLLDKKERAEIYFLLDGKLTGFVPARLPDYSTAFGLTIHKSQGSEFENVVLVLPDRLTKVLSRELLYTGVSRARNTVEIIASRRVLRDTIIKKTSRNSGLSDHLWAEKPI